MSTVRVVTDSGADLPWEVARRQGIEVVPLTIRFGAEDLRDGLDLSTEEFWARCSRQLPTTAAPPPGRFEETFRAAAGRADAVVCVVMSQALSGTIESATVAARAVADVVPVEVVDSRTVSLGQGMVAVTAAELAAAGGRLDEVAHAARAAAAATRSWAALDTLDHLRRGGRIGGARALLATVLAVKPIIELRNGSVEASGKVRTRSRALAYLAERVQEHLPVSHLGVVHAGAAPVDELVDRLVQLTGSEPLVGELGPVVGTHTGPGTVGVCFQTGV